ncbi:MAG: endonuclease/exonuclease/phosphatase family protein [Bacillota bacterium]
MKKLVVLFTALLLFIIPVGSAFVSEPLEAPDKAIPLKVMSYNIHQAEGVDGVLSLERIVKVIFI